MAGNKVTNSRGEKPREEDNIKVCARKSKDVKFGASILSPRLPGGRVSAGGQKITLRRRSRGKGEFGVGTSLVFPNPHPVFPHLFFPLLGGDNLGICRQGQTEKEDGGAGG